MTPSTILRKCLGSDAEDTGALGRGQFAASDGATQGSLADPEDGGRLARGVRPIVRGTGHPRVRDAVHRLLIHGNGSIPDGRSACKGPTIGRIDAHCPGTTPWGCLTLVAIAAKVVPRT